MLGYESKKKPNCGNCSIFYLFTPGDSKIGNILNIKKSKDVRSGLRGGLHAVRLNNKNAKQSFNQMEM
jgi:hypothetical protein